MLTAPQMRPAASARVSEAAILSAAATPAGGTHLASITPTADGGAASPTHLAFAAPVPAVPEVKPAPKAVIAQSRPAEPPAAEPAAPVQVMAFAAMPEPESRQGAIPLPPAFSRPAPGLRSPERDDSAVSRAPARPMLASLPPADNPGDRPAATMLPGPGSRFALYDIEGATVYLPNGERLEAHSGLGEHFDDPSSIARKNRGVTPPNTYDLRMRESLFHGVAAIRLLPVAGSQMFGRDGMLAHTYMLGPRGDSNGCVSFKDYARFLAAFKRGDFTRLVVVKRLDAASSRVASAGKTKRFLWWNL
jgi:hypothetical protein